ASGLRTLLDGSGYGFSIAPDGVVRISPLERRRQVAAPAPRKAEQTRAGQMRSADVTSLDQVTVSARKRDERWLDVPIAVSVMQGTQIEALGLANAAKALDLMPGVSTVDG